MIIEGDKMYRNTVEPNNWAAETRKLAKRTSSQQGRCHIGSLKDELRIDRFFNRDIHADENIFNELNRYFIDLERLRTHIIQSLPEWENQISGSEYLSVNIKEYQNLISILNKQISENGNLLSIVDLERRAGGISQDRINIRPFNVKTLGWKLIRESILRISRIAIEREINDSGGYNYLFFLEVHPKFQELIGIENFNISRKIIETSTDFNPDNTDDLRIRVEREIVYRKGQEMFRKSVRREYGDVCAVTGCNDPRGMEAAHIMNYKGEKSHHVTNGILLRADIHKLFDNERGSLLRIEIVEDIWRLRVDQSLMQSTYAKYEGIELNLPNNSDFWPNIEALRKAGWLVD